MSALLAQARLQACRHWPFASHAILSMVPVARPGLGTLAVDQHWRLYYDEAVLQRIGVEQSAGLVLHELDHLLKRHHQRGKLQVADNSQWETWNEATDASINSGLRAEGVPLPAGLIYPEQFNLPSGLAAEDYFRQLSPEQTDDPQTPPETQTDATPADQQSDAAAPDDAGSRTDDQATDDRDAEGSSTGTDPGAGGDGEVDGAETESCPSSPAQPQPIGSSGSCSDGRQRPWELPPRDDDNPGLDEADQQQIIHVTAQNVIDKQRGNGSGGHRHWAEDILNPPVDPASRLMKLVRRYCDVTVGVGERSYRRPNRRNGNPRMALPGNVAPLPRITVIVDTSGSMGRDDLGLALGMIRKVLNSFRIRDGIQVITGDTQGQAKQLCLSNPQAIELTGGGGTDMAVVIADALDQRPRPQMILVCTDGWTPWPKANPGVPIVACLTNPVSTLPEVYQVPDWIVTLELTGSSQ